MLKLRSLSKDIFKTNAEYEFLSAGSFASESLQYQKDHNLDKIIRSKRDGAMKLVCKNTARVLASFQEQASIPTGQWDATELNTVLARLVLDGVLRILWNGQFLSGSSAWIALFEGEHPQEKSHCLASDALCYAQALRLKNPLQLSMRLYTYNSVPNTHFWRKRFPDSAAVIQFLGSPTKKHLTQNRGWLAWQAKRWQWHPDKPLYKLYLSPQLVALQECWQSVLPVIIESQAVGLKIGADARGLLRPDKIVAHFENYRALMETADELRKALVGFPWQGVPFTAALDSSGLLSWGVDLPSANCESWRSWLTYRLATAIIDASKTDLPVEPWQYAIERLRLEGINTQDWTPTPELLR